MDTEQGAAAERSALEPGAPAGETVDVVYRGQFQGRRIRLILDSLQTLGRPVNFVWAHPGGAAEPPKFYLDFVESRPGILSSTYHPGGRSDLPSLVRALGRRPEGRSNLAVAIGFTSLWVAQVLRPRQLVWFINGVPEERLLFRDSRQARLLVAGQWRAARMGKRPDVTVTVSRPMSALVRARLSVPAVFELPTAVDREVFKPTPKDAPSLLTYVGSGAPWQDLPLLGSIWAELARLEPDVRFQVVSRDERARVAIAGVPADRAELVAGNGAEHVARLTAGASFGFVIRRPHIVNEVSFPTKFGEYVASGTEVITTDIGWDLGEMVKTTGCGLVVDWRDRPERIAERLAQHLGTRDADAQATACAAAAEALDRNRWTNRVGLELADALASGR